jgi:hypothetical protein
MATELLACNVRVGTIVYVQGRCAKDGGIVLGLNMLTTVENRTFVSLDQNNYTVKKVFAWGDNMSKWATAIKKAREVATDDLLQEAFKRGDDDTTVAWNRTIKQISPIVAAKVVTCHGVEKTLHVLVDVSAQGIVKMELTDDSLEFLVNASIEAPPPTF